MNKSKTKYFALKKNAASVLHEPSCSTGCEQIEYVWILAYQLRCGIGGLDEIHNFDLSVVSNSITMS